MIKIDHQTDNGILELRFTPPVTDKDYTETLVPAIDRAIEASDRVRVLAVVEAGCTDFTLGAMLEDARVGLKHWRGFDRIAVVTDDKVVKTATKALSVFMPCPVAVFAMNELEDARRWLRESLGTIMQIELADGVLQLRLVGKLDSEAFANDLEDLNRYMARYDKIRLLIDLREFDGWQGLGALRDHMELIRGHAPKVERAAVVGDAGWQEMAINIGKRAFGLDARYFDEDEFEKAKAWLMEKSA